MQEFDKSFFENLICNSSKYFAHKLNGCEERSPELLSEHSSLVCLYAKQICKKNNLEPFIERLIKSFIPKQFDKNELSILLEELFWMAIACHDLGKINDKFQKQKMDNHHNLYETNHSFDHKHSLIGAYLYLALAYSKIKDIEDDDVFDYVFSIIVFFCHPIIRHHESTIIDGEDNKSWNLPLLLDGSLDGYIKECLNIDLDDDDIDVLHKCLENLFNVSWDTYNDIIKEEPNFPLYGLTKLCYSLLTVSDYLATAHYMNNWEKIPTDFGLLTDELRNKIVESARSSKSYNKIVFEMTDANNLMNPYLFVEQNNNNLNSLRMCIAQEVVLNIRKNKDKRLFYIEAPTGGGKTNSSILAVSELLRLNDDINKIFYVFPFTTIITQTLKSIKETLDLSDNEVAEIHSKAPFPKDGDEDNGAEYMHYIDNMLLNYPICLMSHVKFFDILKSNKKEVNYIFHRLANSVVIIDEVQSYSPSTWSNMMYFIKNYSELFNVRFILMSATLPKIGEILSADFVNLIDNKNVYFQNPNFRDRVSFDYSLLDWEKPTTGNKQDYLIELSHYVNDKSIEYSDFNRLYPNSVFTIIEFIFKKTASDFYSIISNQDNCFDEILLLSGTIMEPQRKVIINKLKSEEYRQKRILLVTTQVVEAGVDIDMDLGFKDKSLIDSEEQLAGRVNRNVNKSNCKLYVFDCDTEKTIYGEDERYSMTNNLPIEDYKNILATKDFDYLYKLVIDNITQKNSSRYIVNTSVLEKHVSTLNFAEVDKSLKIIDTHNYSVFVPLKIDISLIQDYKNLIENLGITYSDCLDGEDVWGKYLSILQSDRRDFIQTNIMLKKIYSIMSLFTFTIFPKGKDFDILKTYGKEEYGYLYLASYQSIYSFENGIDFDAIDLNSFYL